MRIIPLIILVMIKANCFAHDISLITIKDLNKKYSIGYQKIQDKIRLDMQTFPIASSHNSTWAKPTIPEVFVLNLPNGCVYSDYGITIIENHLVTELLWPWSDLKKGLSKIDSDKLPKLKYISGKLAVIAQEGYNNYYHWITEILPKIIILQANNIEYDWLYMPPLKLDFMKQSLKIMGVDLNKVIEADKNTYLKPDVLIVPSFVSQSCYTPYWVTKLLKDKFIDSTNEIKYNFNDKIFISRSKAKYRKITNEEDLFKRLEVKGFKKYYLEDLSVPEQISLFRGAKIIVAAHGAGLANLVFCKKGTKVIELFQEHEDDTYWYLSDVLKLKHFCIKTTNFKKNGGYSDTTILSQSVDSILEIL